MVCNACKKTISGDAIYCPYCGKPQSGHEAKYESCIIEWVPPLRYSLFGGKAKQWFRAKAIGPNGLYNAGEVEFATSHVYSDDPRAMAALEELVQKLVMDGWQIVEMGSNPNNWWSHRFQRFVK